MTVFLPCLLERWCPQVGETARADDGARRFNNWADVRRDVVRNLEWLLNTEQPSALASVSPLPTAVQTSVLCYGIPAYSGKVQSAFKVEDLAWAIRERIIAFEPSIEAATLSVTALDSQGGGQFNRMRFTIHGFLRADPLPIEFQVQSEIDMESGSARVID